MVFDDAGVLRPTLMPRTIVASQGSSQELDSLLAIVLDRRNSGLGRALIALVGKVFCQVQAGEDGPL